MVLDHAVVHDGRDEEEYQGVEEQVVLGVAVVVLKALLKENRPQQRGQETHSWCEGHLPWCILFILSDISADELQIEGDGCSLGHECDPGEDKVHASHVEVTSLEPKEDLALFGYLVRCLGFKIIFLDLQDT